MSETPKTYFEALQYLVEHAGSIYVRVQILGTWGPVRLCDMPDDLCAEHMHRLALRMLGREPEATTS